MFGKIELATFGEAKLPQAAASAWAVVNDGLTGASYKPLLYVGTRIVRGVNHVFLAEQTLITNPPARKIVLLEVNEFGGEYSLVRSSIVEVVG